MLVFMTQNMIWFYRDLCSQCANYSYDHFDRIASHIFMCSSVFNRRLEYTHGKMIPKRVTISLQAFSRYLHCRIASFEAHPVHFYMREAHKCPDIFSPKLFFAVFSVDLRLFQLKKKKNIAPIDGSRIYLT